MKVTCPNCRLEQELAETSLLEAAAGQGFSSTATCTKCGGILPSFAVAVASAAPVAEPAPEADTVPPSAELAAIRSELEAEVGPLFDTEPNREIKLGGYRLGDRRKNPRIVEPGTPAYKVVEVSGHDHDDPPASQPEPDLATAAADALLVPGAAPLAAKEKEPATAAEKEVVWQPAASSLSALIQEQFSTRKREPEAPVDELVKPPEIKHKPAPPPPPERRPPPAFDGDFPVPPVTDPNVVDTDLPELVAEATPRADSLITASQPPVVVAPAPNKTLIIGAAVAFVVLVTLLGVVLALLLRSPQFGGRGAIAQPQTQPAVVPPVAVPQPAALDAATAAAIPDAASAFTVLPPRDAAIPAAKDAAGTAVAVGKVPDNDYVGENPRPIDKPAGKVGSDTVKKPDKPARDDSEDEEEEDEKKPAVPPGTRPPGCDAVLFPNPSDCPTSGPPGKEQILAVVRKHLGDIDVCAKRQHQINPELATGVVEMRFWILATGETSRVEVLTDQFKKAPVGLCIKAAIERWNFGEYDGPKIGPIKFPFKLKVE